MKLKYLIIISAGWLFFAACNKLNDDFNVLLTNPNQPSITSADADLYLNQIQLSFKNFYNDVQGYGDALTRMEIMYGPNYKSAYQPQSFDGMWTNAYASIFTNTNAMLTVAESGKLYMHAGISKILKAYTMITLVDIFGDIPYSEANKGVENTNPAADDGKAVYDSALALLDDAIADLSQEAPQPKNDLFYGGDPVAWTTLAKTLKLKAYIQTRLVDPSVKDKINALITGGDLITSSSQDFQFKYGTQDLAPDSRHPKYAGNYTSTNANDYLGNYFMWTLYEEKGIIDPRIRYYFYRQTLNIEDAISDPVTLQFTIPCLERVRPSWYPAGIPFCQVGDGYVGRDHGNNEGIPPDNQYRATWGVYPAAGEFDADQGVPTEAGMGGKGAGINPMWLSSFTYFVEAESALTLGTTGDPESLLEQGIRASFAKVFSFPAAVGVTVPDAYVADQAQQDSYVNLVKSNYEAAATTDAKLNVIMTEYYIALWGNGIEAYNNYRRTGKPSNMQPCVYDPPSTAGFFIRSFYYPSVYVNLNKSAAQKPNPGEATVKVFWDTNPDDFVH